MRGISGIDPGWGVTVVRVAFAIIMIHAGWLKWFQAGVTTGVTQSMAKMGFPVPGAFAFVAATMELGGGILLLIGLFGRWLGLLFAIQFAIATLWVKLPGAGFPAARLDILLVAAALLFFLAGSGRASVDEDVLGRG
jgi:putative oxidoreductase